jgi:hypothetical protein
MTTIVSQTTSAPNTKNTKDNRKVLVAEHTICLVYKIPDNLDLEDKTIVKEYWVRNSTMYIQYTSEEYFRQYYKDDEKTDFRIDKDNYFVQNIQCDYGMNMLTNPTKKTTIEDADKWKVDYDDKEDEEDDEDEEDEDEEDEEDEDEEDEEEEDFSGKFYVHIEKRIKDGYETMSMQLFDTEEEARTDFEIQCMDPEIVASNGYRVEFGNLDENGNPDETIEYFENEYTEEDDEEDEEDEEDGITEEMLQDFRAYAEKLKDIKSLQELRDYEADMKRQNKWWLQAEKDN